MIVKPRPVRSPDSGSWCVALMKTAGNCDIMGDSPYAATILKGVGYVSIINIAVKLRWTFL